MPGKMAVERAVSEMLPAGEWPGGERSASASVRGAKVQKHASLPLDLTARDAPASAAFVRAASRVGSAGTALSGAPSASAAALSEDQALAMEAKAAAMQLKYESKADCLNTGLVHPDWKMRKAAAIELPLHCERRPVETFVVREYLKLLQDPVMDVRQTTLEHLPDLVERGDRSAIRAVLHRMWGDVSWAVRLASIHCIEKIAHVGDEQAILGVVARITDPEAARGGTFWVRAAAREAALRLSGSEHGLKLVMDRLKDESWDTQQQSLQCMLLGAKKIPCRLDDVDDVRGPFQQGYHSPPNPKHMAMDKAVRGHGANSDDDDFEPYDEAAARRLKNGYEASTHQSEIIPRQLLPHWEPPDNHGKAPHEQTHEWTRGWRFTLEATGLEGAHYTELSGRHYKETARSAYLKLKAAGGYASLGSGTRSKTANAPSKHKTHSLAEDHDEEWLDTAATGATMDDDFETSEEQQARANKAAGKGDSKFGSRDPRLGKKGGVANQSADSKLQVSEAEVKRAEEHQKVLVARRASLRTLRRRKSLATCHSSLHSSSAMPQSEFMRIRTGMGGTEERRESALSWADLEDANDVISVKSSSADGRRQGAESPQEEAHPMRDALPYINRKSFTNRGLRKTAAAH